MMGRTAASAAAFVLITFAASVKADDTKAGSAVGATGEWGGFYNGQTLGGGGGEVIAEAGYPGGTAGVLFGIGNAIDLGVKVSALFNAQYETDALGSLLAFGTSVRAVARFAIYRGDTVSLLARVEPGIQFIRFDTADLDYGPMVDVGIDVGIKVMTGGSIYLGLEVPFAFTVPNGVFAFQVQIPIFPGAGFEYHFNDFIGIGARVNAGPSITAGDFAGSATVAFGFLAQGLFMFRWDRVK
jgi:hypothetical protein